MAHLSLHNGLYGETAANLKPPAVFFPQVRQQPGAKQGILSMRP